MFDLASYVTVMRVIVNLLHTATRQHNVRGGGQRRRVASTINHKHRRRYILAVVVMAQGLLVIAGLAAANW